MAPCSAAARSLSLTSPVPKLPASAMLFTRREIASAVESTFCVLFTFCPPSNVSPFLSSRNTVQTLRTASSSGRAAGRRSCAESCFTRLSTISTSASRFFGLGKITMLKRRFSAADISFTPLSRVFAVAISEKPRAAACSRFNSGIETRFSESREMRASCTSGAQREISSNRAILPSSIARKIGVFTSARSLGPSAIKSA